jgi:transcriptional regulator with XRE-family HTH domain
MDDVDPKIIGQRIRQLRLTNGKSLVAMGQYLGRSHAAMSDIELGKTNLTVQDLTKIASFLGVSVNDILQEPAAAQPQAHTYFRDAKGITPEQKRDADRATSDFLKKIEELKKGDGKQQQS